MSFDWRARLETVPHEPGVYLMRNHRGAVVYVGKAADLHARLRSYFVGGGRTRASSSPRSSRSLRDIETILVRSAKEALILENHLIKKHQPRFNVKLKDDKDFLQLRLDPSRDYPRLEVVRKRRRDGALYFGPLPLGARDPADAQARRPPLPAPHVQRHGLPHAGPGPASSIRSGAASPPVSSRCLPSTTRHAWRRCGSSCRARAAPSPGGCAKP